MQRICFFLLLAYAAGCAGESGDDVSPRDLAQAALAYLQMGSSRVQDYLAPEEISRLRENARLRPDLHLMPADLLYLRIPAPSISGDGFKTETLFSDAEKARIAVANGKERLRMDFVRTGGRWRLKLPVTMVQP